MSSNGVAGGNGTWQALGVVVAAVTFSVAATFAVTAPRSGQVHELEVRVAVIESRLGDIDARLGNIQGSQLQIMDLLRERLPE